MSDFGVLGIMDYKTGFWDKVWKWKEKMKELKMEVVKVPFPTGQITLQLITCMHPFIITKMKQLMMENMS